MEYRSYWEYMNPNEEAVEGWKNDTDSHERVWSVLRRSDQWLTAENLASRARVDIADAADLVGVLSDIGLVERRDDAYRVEPGLRVALDGLDVLAEVDETTLEERLDELHEEDADETTRRNRAIAEIAVSLRDALDYY